MPVVEAACVVVGLVGLTLTVIRHRKENTGSEVHTPESPYNVYLYRYPAKNEEKLLFNSYDALSEEQLERLEESLFSLGKTQSFHAMCQEFPWKPDCICVTEAETGHVMWELRFGNYHDLPIKKP